jgi:hypothetical protein
MQKANRVKTILIIVFDGKTKEDKRKETIIDE